MNKLNKFWIVCFGIFFLLIPIIFVKFYIWLTICTFIGVIYVGRKVKFKYFPIVLFLLSLLVRLVFNLVVETPPNSDFLVLFNASKMLLNGDISFNQSNYFFLWAYQVGFVWFQTILLYIWDSIFFLKLVNCLVSSCICVLIYLIAKEFVKESSARVVSVIYLLLPFTISYTSVLSNQHFASLLIYLSFYILICKKIRIKDIYKYFIVGILLAISNIIRPEAIITIFSLVIYIILGVRKETIKKSILLLSILLVSYYGVLRGANYLFIKSNIGPYGLANNAPYWKLVLGFNHETKGGYSNNDTVVLNDEEAALELIKERVMVSPIKYVSLFKAKIKYFWNSTTLAWSFYEIFYKNFSIGNYTFNLSNILMMLEAYNTEIMFVLYCLVLIGIFYKFRGKSLDSRLVMIINQVFVTFGVYLLIEVQSRYSYTVQISICILASLGIDYLLDLYDKKKKI